MRGLTEGEQLTLTATAFVPLEYVERLVALAAEHGFEFDAPIDLPERQVHNEKVAELRAAFDASPPNSEETWLGIEHFKFIGHILLGYRSNHCSAAFKALVFPITKNNGAKNLVREAIDRADINLAVSTREIQGYLPAPERKTSTGKHAIKSQAEMKYAKRFGPEDANELLIQTGNFIDLSKNEATLDRLDGITSRVRSLIDGMALNISARITGSHSAETII